MTMPDRNEESDLSTFLRNHDIPCPKCEYNLRGLKAPKCPECGHPVHFRFVKNYRAVSLAERIGNFGFVYGSLLGALISLMTIIGTLLAATVVDLSVTEFVALFAFAGAALLLSACGFLVAPIRSGPRNRLAARWPLKGKFHMIAGLLWLILYCLYFVIGLLVA